MSYDIDLTRTFLTETDAAAFAYGLRQLVKNEFIMGPLCFTYDKKFFPEQNGRQLNIFGQIVTLDIAHHNVEALFASMHAPEFRIQGVRLHILPNQLGEGFQAYTDMLGDAALQEAAKQLEVSPKKLTGMVFGVSTDGITAEQLQGEELRDYAGDLQRMAIEVFDGLEPLEPHDKQMRFFAVKDGEAIDLGAV